MNITPNTEKLNEILVTFYKVNGVRIVVFDGEYNEIAAYPEEKCDFCKTIRQSPKLNELCRKCDIENFEICRRTGKLNIYHCHAGLAEAVIPLHYDNQVIGYMMIGQITDLRNAEELENLVAGFNRKHGTDCDSSKIKFRSEEQIAAIAEILKICGEYVMLKEMLRPQNSQIVAEAKDYVKKNLSEPITVQRIAKVCHCSRTKLYEAFQKECGIGIAKYITEKKMHLAKTLLKTTDLSVAEIGMRCGYDDDNHFRRVYKKHYGKTPSVDRREE